MGNFRLDPVEFLSDDLVLKLFSYLSHKEIISVSYVCRNWFRISRDETLWRRRLLWDYFLRSDFDGSMPTNPTHPNSTWFGEYQRLIEESPIVEAETLTAHKDEVLHVAFSNNGRLFSTCSKDCFIRIWTSAHPCRLLLEENLESRFGWQFSQFSQFNADDTLILVSGAMQCPNDTTGEIAVFAFDPNGLHFRCRVVIRPYDIFGSWFSEDLFLTGSLDIITGYTSCTRVWICKSSLEPQHPKTLIMSKLFNFLGLNAGTIRRLLIANKVPKGFRESACVFDKLKAMLDVGADFELNEAMSRLWWRDDADKKQEEDFYSDVPTSSSSVIPKYLEKSQPFPGSTTIPHKKLLIYVTGAEAYTPHKVCFKLVHFDKKLSSSEVQERRKTRNKEVDLDEHGTEIEQPEAEFDEDESPFVTPGGQFGDFQPDAAYMLNNFDFPDHTIDMRGHVVGLTLSPDEKYLFVNVRPWPDMAISTHPLKPPKIVEQIELRVIDMETLLVSESLVFRGHQGFTSSEKCFHIFANASDTFVASASEDNAAYIWHRQYGALLARLPHQNVVNAVAFNPKNDQMMVSVSDDFTIKVWRSKKAMRQQEVVRDMNSRTISEHRRLNG